MNNSVATDVSNCRECQGLVDFQLRPIFLLPASPKVVLISQAPGKLAHDSGIAWNDNSGEKLRSWLGVDRDTFYKSGKFAVVPMSFCFPGYKNGADAPPFKKCRPLWHEKVLSSFTEKFLTIYIGRYAQQQYLPMYKTLTQAIFEHNSPDEFVLPHPSGRNNRWMARYPEFEQIITPKLQKLVSGHLR